MKSFKKFLGLTLCALPVLALTGCTRDHQFQPVDMWNDTRLKPLEPVNIPGGTTAVSLPAGTVARGQLVTAANEGLMTGKENGKLMTAFPFQVDDNVIRRGQQRYTIYCAPCHGGLGDGNGIIVQRGFAKPPDYLDPRVMNAPVGHYYDVITNGYGAMYSYAARVPVNDRWAITAYIRVLQKARKGKVGGVKPGAIYDPSYIPTEAKRGKSHGGGHAASGQGDAPKGAGH